MSEQPYRMGDERAPAADYSGCRPPARAALAPVSHETLPQPEIGRRGYFSPVRTTQGDRTRAALVAALLASVAAGRFRPEARDLARVAGVHKSAVTRHYGALHLLYRVIAREHAEAVVEAMQRHGRLAGPVVEADVKPLAWLVMVGEPKELR